MKRFLISLSSKEHSDLGLPWWLETVEEDGSIMHEAVKGVKLEVESNTYRIPGTQTHVLTCLGEVSFDSFRFATIYTVDN
jgi:hypothetical protein